MYYLGLFNSSELQGNIFTIGILFGISEVLGILIGEPIVHHFPPHLASYFSLTMVLVTSNMVKLDLDQKVIYGLFLVQIFFIGLTFNLYFVMATTRISPRLLSTSFELNTCFGQLLTFFSPLIAKLPEPFPTLFYWLFCLTAFLMVVKIGPPKK
jgi:hypothetical protein